MVDMNRRLALLQPYPFERLAALNREVTPPEHLSHIMMSIGEPKHPAPAFVVEALQAALGALGTYPAAAGLPEFRAACAGWLRRRFGVAGIDAATMVLPVNGTREALFAFAQAVIDTTRPAAVLMPNPFYQIYEGAALLAGAEPVFMNTTAATGYLPDLDAVPVADWRRCQLLYVCSPGNPTGAVMDLAYLRRVLELADRYGFVVAADECYADLYDDEATPPPGLLAACEATGRSNYERCVVFHSLSKRSSVPGLRSGFVAGDPAILAAFRLYRTYHGCALPVHVQQASIPAWNDDAHAAANRALYRAKFDAVLPILSEVLELRRPPASFYLWPRVEGSDEALARELFAAQHLTVLPGSYLARDTASGNPGRQHLRISLVAPLTECVEAALRIRDHLRKS
jgi:N-succinyldiaminopimelate aminotransferase